MAQSSASWDGPVPASAEVVRNDGHTLVVLHGEFDLDTVDVLADALTRARLGDDDVVVDLRDVGFMGAVTLAALLRHRDLLARRSRSLTVRDPSPEAALTLDVGGGTGLVAHRGRSACPCVPPNRLGWPPRPQRLTACEHGRPAG